MYRAGRQSAARVVGLFAITLSLLISTGCGRLTKEMLADLDSENPDTWGRGATEVIESWPRASGELLAWLAGADEVRARKAAQVLVGVPLASVGGEIRRLSKSTDARTRFYASRVRVWLEAPDAAILDAMAEGLESGVRDRRDLACYVLIAEIPPGRLLPSDRLAAALGKALTWEDPKERAMGGVAAKVLAHLGPRYAMPVLISALEDHEAMWWAIGALADLGPAAKDAVPALERISNGGEGIDDGQRKQKAWNALRRIRGS